MGIFNILKRKRKPTTQELVAQAFKTLETLEKSHLLAFDQKARRLYIEQPIAILMAANEESWLHFMQNCYLWISYRVASESWDNYILNEEIKAVHRARKRFDNLTPNDIDRIKRVRRVEITQNETNPPTIDSFEFFVVRETTAEEMPSETTDGANGTIPCGEIYAVGTYDSKTDNWQGVTWNKIKNFLNKESSSTN